ncbi:hypothetical protein ElyMa_006177100 [Elysia marginata]|uniref:Uncharacterized protein n=1 Tax=Elysia marginata TaxID=1093978 RepID=A0AAV4H1T6_9GAST|nr:hypothetical protein ElyMa_006177100 [Elysia marginata]
MGFLGPAEFHQPNSDLVHTSQTVRGAESASGPQARHYHLAGLYSQKSRLAASWEDIRVVLHTLTQLTQHIGRSPTVGHSSRSVSCRGSEARPSLT